jgi:hypothetical protein
MGDPLLPLPNLLGAPEKFDRRRYTRSEPLLLRAVEDYLRAPNKYWRNVPCRLWPGAISGGYATIRRNGRLRRVSREILARTGRLTKHGTFACHHCDNPECYEGLHLFEGTYVENNQDRVSKGRSRGGRFLGEAHPNSKLTNEAVAEIRALPCIRRVDRSRLEKQFGVSASVLYEIRSRAAWGHL